MAVLRKTRKGPGNKKKKNPDKQPGRRKGRRHNSDILIKPELKSSGITSRKAEIIKKSAHELLLNQFHQGKIKDARLDAVEEAISKSLQEAMHNSHMSFFAVPISDKKGNTIKTIIIDIRERNPKVYIAEDSLEASKGKKKEDKVIRAPTTQPRAFDI